MEIIFHHIKLRPWQPDDVIQLGAIANNKKIADNLRDGFPHPYSIYDAQMWLDSVIPINNPARFFAIFYFNTFAGSIGLVAKEDIYRKNIEIGYFVAEEFWGKGIATLAIRAATNYAFERFDIARIYAEPFADNKGSRRALEKAGYRHEAIFRKNVFKNNILKDSCIYSMLREEHLPDSNIIINSI